MKPNKDYDHLVKIILIGNTNAGKSSLVNRYAKNKFCNDFAPTIGIDFSIKVI